MSTCSTCRYWGTTGREFVYENDAGAYVDGETPQHMCARIIHGNDGAATPPLTEPAMVCDGSGYSATLWTLPTFACSLHEAKP